MGDIQKRLKDGTWEKSMNINKYKRCLKVFEINIPVLSLEYEYHVYLVLGKVEKANMIKACLEKTRGVHNSVQSLTFCSTAQV